LNYTRKVPRLPPDSPTLNFKRTANVGQS